MIDVSDGPKLSPVGSRATCRTDSKLAIIHKNDIQNVLSHLFTQNKYFCSSSSFLEVFNNVTCSSDVTLEFWYIDFFQQQMTFSLAMRNFYCFRKTAY